MNMLILHEDDSVIPNGRQRHHSYDESVDESARLIEEEQTEIEAEVPAEENEPVERGEKDEPPATPAFEDEDEPPARD
jgi:hypothetical protein